MKKHLLHLCILIICTTIFSFDGFSIPSGSISSFSPSSGPVGTLVTIIGANLQGANSVSIGGVDAIIISDTSKIAQNYGDTLVAMVMPGAVTGNIVITKSNSTINSNGQFNITKGQYPNTQQGPKLTGTDYVGSSVDQGSAVALSADGNTAVIGGNGDNNNIGSAWIYKRVGGIWNQQGTKLVGQGYVGASVYQGTSVAISADGNTVLVGGYGDSSNVGAAWVFTNNNGVYSQQGNKLVGSGHVGKSYQGYSVSLSADGKTAVIGGYGDNSFIGAIWIFSCAGGNWTQQGGKIVGTGYIGNGINGGTQQGQAVSISADGNTIIEGGAQDNNYAGASWVFAKNNGSWLQQGNKLVGSGAKSPTNQGFSVSLSADGNTALIGGEYDSTGTGALWVFTRTGNVWSQQGNKIKANGEIGMGQLGRSVSLSADGNTAIAGANLDSSYAGAAFIFTRVGTSWSQSGKKLVGTGAGTASNQGSSIAISSDGTTALVGGVNDNNNLGAAWCFNSVVANTPKPTISSFFPISGPVGTLIKIIGTNLQGATSLSIGGVNGIIISDTSVISKNYGDTLVGLVMPGAATGIITISTTNGNTTSANVFTVSSVPSPSLQQGNKLVGGGNVGVPVYQGCSISLSTDGNTAIVGGYGDNSNIGAAWIYTRSNGAWSQQGNKLVGTGYVGSTIYQGTSVAISADGNTAIIGGYGDSSNVGAAWIFTRNNGVWNQQGNKLVGTGHVGTSKQGYSVSLSADGNTAVVGGYGDNNLFGAVWVFSRSAGVWNQQGSKLLGNGTTGGPQQGQSVAISADGNTIIEGGPQDNGYAGASWVFTKSAGNWTQQGNKLVGTGAIGGANQGFSVAISADGNTALVGGDYDSSGVGALWVFVRAASAWNQQGSKIKASTEIGWGQLGHSVSISADGNTIISGSNLDASYVGSAFIFKRNSGAWTQSGTKLVGSNFSGVANQGFAVAISGDGSTSLVGGTADNSSLGAVWPYYNPSQPSLTLKPTNITCSGNQNGSINASVIGGTSPYSYSWSNGSNGIGDSIISNLSPTTYTVTLTDNNNFTSTSSVTITSPSQLSVNLIGTTSLLTSCNGAISATVTGGTTNYTYTWSNYYNIPTISGLCAGRYDLTVADANGCIANAGLNLYFDSIKITTPQPLTIYMNIKDASANNACDGLASPSVTGGTPPYNYLYSDKTTIGMHTGLCQGNYQLVVTDKNGAKDSVTFIISSPSNTYTDESKNEKNFSDSTKKASLLNQALNNCSIFDNAMDSIKIHSYSVKNSDSVSVAWYLYSKSSIDSIRQNYKITVAGVYTVILQLYCQGNPAVKMEAVAGVLKGVGHVYIAPEYVLTNVNSITNDITENSVVYPNPFQEKINLSLNFSGKFTLKLIDLTGRNVIEDINGYTKNNYETISIPNLSQLAAGTYILNILHSKGTENHKLIKTN